MNTTISVGNGSVAATLPKATRKATSAEKAPQGRTKAKATKPSVARASSKTAKILDRSNGSAALPSRSS